MSDRPIARRNDRTQREVQMPSEADRRWAEQELRERVRHGRAGDEAVALLLDAYDRSPEHMHYRRWLAANGWLDQGPEVA